MPNTAEENGACGCAEPGTRQPTHCCCAVDDLVRAIGRKHTMSILNRIGLGADAHFTDIQRALDLSSSTLAHSLDELSRMGLVHRLVIPARPPCTTYSLTPAGRVLVDRFRPLLDRVREVSS
ncbi:MAG: helix-turn-helix transcriptional regulator [Gemmatimonadales bacterium]|nr:helix-turn-helix transcriptional regulator [Gemmatimonadales bacterium]